MSEWPLNKRQFELRKLRSIQPTSTYPIGLRGGRQEFPVYEVDIELPHFRLENMRTKAAQREYIRAKGADYSFFKDPDSEAAQVVQRDILWDMVKGTAILDVLTSGVQTEPLILDKDGYVVNGNRRLCAMRHLLRKDAQVFQRYGRVRVIILPEDFNEAEVQRLEAELQIYPDTKLEYSWVDLALSKRGLLDSGVAEEDVCALYKEDVKALKEQVGSLALAEKYLIYKGREERYSELPKAEHTFYRLFENSPKLKSAAERRLLEQIVFTLLDDPTGVSRIYTLIPDMVKDFAKVVARLQSEIQTSDITDETPSVESGFSEIFGNPGLSSDVTVGQLNQEIKTLDETGQQLVRDTVVDVVESIRFNEKNKKSSEQTFQLVKSARTKLQDAITSLDGKSKLDGIEVQLSAIDTLVITLREKTSARNKC